jgi:putative MFS transporter
VFAFNCFGGAVGTIAAPYVLKYSGLTTKQSLQFSLAGYVVSMVGVLVGFVIIDRVSRRWLGVVTTFLAFLAGSGMAFFAKTSPVAMVSFYLIFQLVVWIGPAVLVWVWSNELFPTHLRATGGGLTQSACRLAIALNISFVPLGLALWGLSALIVFAIAYLVVCGLVLSFRFFDTTATELESSGG